MGITGLIPFMEKSSRRASVGEFAGSIVAVDAYCWLHKGAYSCIEQLVNGEPCQQYIKYCVNLAQMLQRHNVHPILVFDGRHLPAKAETEAKRRQNRDQSRRRAAELLRAGRRAEARSFLQRCLDITHEHAIAVMTALRSIGIDCIVAPYESDAQMAYLNLNEIVQLVITEDSDLVLFGCHKILFKMDSTGSGILVERSRLYLSMGLRQDIFSLDMFRHMAILSGCDYLASLPGIGLGKACKFIKHTRGFDIHKALLRIPQVLKMNIKVPDEYRDDFLLADCTFRYQIVYDPIKRRQCYLTEPFPGEVPPPCVGEIITENEKAFQMALGNLDPFTFQKVHDWDPVKKPVKCLGGFTSIWDTKFKVRPPLRRSPRKHISPMKTVSKVMQCNVQKLVNKIEQIKSVENEDLAKIYGFNLNKEKNDKLKENITYINNEQKEKDIIMVPETPYEESPSPVKETLKNKEKKVLQKENTKGVKRYAEEDIQNISLKKKPAVSPAKRNPFFKSPSPEISPNLLGLANFKSKIKITSRYFQNNSPRIKTSLFAKLEKAKETTDKEDFEVPETQYPEKSKNKNENTIMIVNETPDEREVIKEIVMVPETPNEESLMKEIIMVPETLANDESPKDKILIVHETPFEESPSKEVKMVPETPQESLVLENNKLISPKRPDTNGLKERNNPMPPPSSPIITRFNENKSISQTKPASQSTLAMFGFKVRKKL